METLLKMDDLGVPLFSETAISATGFCQFHRICVFSTTVLTLRNISVGAATTKSFAQLLTLAQSAGSIILHLSVHANDLDGLPIVVIETSNHHLPTSHKYKINYACNYDHL